MGFSRQEHWSEVPLPSPNEESSWSKRKEIVSGELGETCIQSGAHIAAHSPRVPGQLGLGRKPFHTSPRASPFRADVGGEEVLPTGGQRTHDQDRPGSVFWLTPQKNNEARPSCTPPSLREAPGLPPFRAGHWPPCRTQPCPACSWVPALSWPWLSALSQPLLYFNNNEILAHSQQWINVYNLELGYIKARCWHSLFPSCLKFETRKTGLWG